MGSRPDASHRHRKKRFSTPPRLAALLARSAIAAGMTLAASPACRPRPTPLGASAVEAPAPSTAPSARDAPTAGSAGDAARAAHPSARPAAASAAPDAAGELEPGDVALPIAARAQAPEAPPSGWCGETAIQEALLHVGVWAPQRAIHRAGKPAHPDLYSPDMPVALDAFGVQYTWFAGRGRGYVAFSEFAREAIDAGDPVLAGVKLLPTQHPEWGLDHFVLVVGYGRRGLLVNTTWGRREWIAKGVARGISLDTAAWAARIRGVTVARGATPARLAAVAQRDSSLVLRATCDPGLVVEGTRSPALDLTVAEGTITRVHCVRP